MSQSYQWERFWSALGEPYTDDDGFLYDPRSQYAAFDPNRAKSFEDIENTPCLVLLGEPGLGKSYALNQASERVAASGLEFIRLDFIKFMRMESFLAELFESERFLDAARNGTTLTLLLDGLDEAVEALKDIHLELAKGFRKALPTAEAAASIRLRLSCRTAQWPESFGNALKSVWGENSVGVFELLPLRLRDVRDAAEAQGLSADAFLAAVRQRGLQPLARKPVTLNFLLGIFAERQALPDSLTTLYERGCQLLCDDSNPGRRERDLLGKLDAAQRLAVAKRIAAASIFSNRLLLLQHGLGAEGQIGPVDIAGGVESVGGAALPTTEAAIRETLNTGLFTGASAGALTWSHQTYAEYLAASYLVGRQMELATKQAIIREPGKDIPGSLQETAAWIAAMDTEFADWLLETAPQILIRSDVRTTDPALLSRLASRLLSEFDKGNLRPWSHGLRRHYHKLAQPGLAGVLRPYIEDAAKTAHVRDAAIEIARACKCVDLEAAVLAVAVDKGADIELRSMAIAALRDIGSPDSYGRLRELWLSQDAPLRIKAGMVAALWPGHLSDEDLFRFLPSVDSEEFAAFHTFTYGDPFESVLAATLIHALKWFTTCMREQVHSFYAGYTGMALIDRAFELVSEPGVADQLADAVVAMASKYLNLQTHENREKGPRNYSVHVDQRRRFLDALFDRIDKDDQNLFNIEQLWPVVLRNDLDWLIQSLHRTNNEKRKGALSRATSRFLNFEDQDAFGRIYDASLKEPFLAEMIRHFIDPIDISGHVAKTGREHLVWLKRSRDRRQSAEVTAAEPRPPAVDWAELNQWIDNVEGGDLANWCRVDMALNGISDSEIVLGDIVETLGWKEAPETLQKRIVSLMRQVAQAHDPWPLGISTTGLDRRLIGICRALRHVLAGDLVPSMELPAERWAALAPAIVTVSFFNVFRAPESHVALLRQGFHYAPEAYLDAVIPPVEKALADGCAKNLIEVLGEIGDPQLLDWVSKIPHTMPKSPFDLIEAVKVLLRLRSNDTLDWICKELGNAPEAGPFDDRLVLIGRTAALEVADAFFDLLQRISIEKPEFAKALWLAASGELRGEGDAFPWQLSDQRRIDLCSTLHRLFPPETDPRHDTGSYSPGPRDDIGRLRDAIVANFENQGTPSSIDALDKIVRLIPNRPYIKHALRAARENWSSKTHKWPTPADVVHLAERSARRLVRSDQELMIVLIEALKRFQRHLYAVGRPIQQLWNERPTATPKEERALSDKIQEYLNLDLAQRGVIVNREVQIRPRIGRGGAAGEDTDILVEVRNPQSAELYSVVIEVKGCWNRGLESDIEGQLINRYLSGNSIRHGIYVVGWYRCTQWDDETDGRLLIARRRDRQQTTERLKAATIAAEQAGIAVSVVDLSLGLPEGLTS